MICPLCDGSCKYEELKTIGKTFPAFKLTHMWVCDECPFIGMEYYEQENIKTVEKRLSAGESRAGGISVPK